MVKKYGIKYFYDITDRSDFRANPDYKGVCHVALAQEGHCKPGTQLIDVILGAAKGASNKVSICVPIRALVAAAGVFMVFLM